MQVFNAGGQQVSEGNGKVDLNDPDHKTMIATLLAAAPPAGDYTVKWHVYLTDGDDSTGTFGFKVAAAPAAQVTAAATETVAASPTAAATAVTTASSTPAPTVAPTSTPAAAVAVAAQATPASPQSLPSTGGDATGVTWPLVAALAAIAVAALLIAGSRARVH